MSKLLITSRNEYTKLGNSYIILNMEYKEGLKLPIGVDSYLNVRTNGFYIDKTLFIEELLELAEGSAVLVTRPRRFGKSLTLSMVHEFFEVNDKIDKTEYFSDTAIWQTKYKEEAFKYPVIHLNFGGCYGDTDEEIKRQINNRIKLEVNRIFRKYEDKFDEIDKQLFVDVITKKINKNDYTVLIYEVSEILNRIFNKPVILLIDEYDLPINGAYTVGVYDKVIGHIRSIFETSIKTNPYLKFALITGVMQIAKESLFSGLNNLKVYNILSSDFDEYFGFTEDEVKEILDYYHFEGDFEEVRKWYDGYLFGEKRVFNPYAILQYIENKFTPASYWNATGSNYLLDKYLINPLSKTFEFLNEITNGTYFVSELNLAVNFRTIQDDFETMVTFLLFAGYLTINEKYDDGKYSLIIPNLDIAGFFKSLVRTKLKTEVNVDLLEALSKSIIKGETKLIEDYLSSILTSFTSFDLNCERNYQMIIVTMSLFLLRSYEVKTEQNIGLGRSDILVTPKENKENSFIFELKYIKEGSEEKLESLANEALKQIKEKEYYKDMLNKGIKKVTLYGFAFSKNKVKAVSVAISNRKS